MALTTKHKEIEFGVGDKVKVIQKIEEGGKTRSSIFEGIVLAIKGGAENTSFLVRRMGEGGIGIERIFPLYLPTIEKIEVVKKGTAGVRRAKLYYTRTKSPSEIEEIYARASLKNQPQTKKSRPKKHARKRKQ